jgi:hypothetical protein
MKDSLPSRTALGQLTALVRLVPTELNVVDSLVESPFMAVTAPSPTNAATSAYSIRSCPESSVIICFKHRLVMSSFSVVHGVWWPLAAAVSVLCAGTILKPFRCLRQ